MGNLLLSNREHSSSALPGSSPVSRFSATLGWLVVAFTMLCPILTAAQEIASDIQTELLGALSKTVFGRAQEPSSFDSPISIVFHGEHVYARIIDHGVAGNRETRKIIAADTSCCFVSDLHVPNPTPTQPPRAFGRFDNSPLPEGDRSAHFLAQALLLAIRLPLPVVRDSNSGHLEARYVPASIKGLAKILQVEITSSIEGEMPDLSVSFWGHRKIEQSALGVTEDKLFLGIISASYFDDRLLQKVFLRLNKSIRTDSAAIAMVPGIEYSFKVELRRNTTSNPMRASYEHTPTLVNDYRFENKNYGYRLIAGDVIPFPGSREFDVRRAESSLAVTRAQRRRPKKVAIVAAMVICALVFVVAYRHGKQNPNVLS